MRRPSYDQTTTFEHKYGEAMLVVCRPKYGTHELDQVLTYIQKFSMHEMGVRLVHIMKVDETLNEKWFCRMVEENRWTAYEHLWVNSIDRLNNIRWLTDDTLFVFVGRTGIV